jgi:hypothetical protein
MRGDEADDQADTDWAISVLRAVARATTFGDFLGGLFALARAEVVRARSLVATIDASISGFLRDDFLIALPALRQAFTYFPPRERLVIAETVLEIHGSKGADPMALLRAPVDAEVVRHAAEVERRAYILAARHGLEDALDEAKS